MLSFTAYTDYGIYIDQNGPPELQYENLIFDIEIVDVKKKEPLPQEGTSLMDQMNQNIKSTEETKPKSTPKKKAKEIKEPTEKKD